MNYHAYSLAISCCIAESMTLQNPLLKWMNDMLLVKTLVKSSKIHGLGLFADEFVAKGTIIWRFTHGFDLRFTAEQMDVFPEPLLSHLKTYAWKSKKSGLYCFSADNGKYFNHSDTPNTLSHYSEEEDEVLTVALRDIEPGEELTDNYNAFEENGEIFSPVQ